MTGPQALAIIEIMVHDEPACPMIGMEAPISDDAQGFYKRIAPLRRVFPQRKIPFLGSGQGPVGNSDSGLFGETSARVFEIDALDFLKEFENVAACAAPEALEDSFRRVDGE